MVRIYIKKPIVIVHALWLVEILCAMGLAYLIFGCASVSHRGHIAVGAYPRHNEAIDGQTGKITKWRGEISEAVRWKMLEIEFRPIFLGGGPSSFAMG